MNLPEESRKIVEKTKADVFKLHINEDKTPISIDVKEAAAEVNEATTKLVDSVDQITDVLLLILSKFDTTIRRINAGAILAILIGFAIFSAIIKIDNIAEKMEGATKASEETRKKLEKALVSLQEVEKSQRKTEVSVEEVKQQTLLESGIKIVPDKSRPGKAKVVISSKEISGSSLVPMALMSESPMKAGMIRKSASSKPEQVSIEIPIDLPKARVTTD